MPYVGAISAAGNTSMPVGSTLYAICDTAAATVAKVGTCSNFNTLQDGVTIHVYFVNSNTATSPTLNVNSTGAKPIYRYGTTAPGTTAATSWQAGSVIALTYNVKANSNGCWSMNDHLDDTNSTGYLPLSGGTMTGTITAKGSVYDDAYTGSLNMNNSNIYGLNSIYTADTSDAASEGIHFYRDATHVDSLWMNGGDLLFVPNREIGTSTTKANSQKVARFTANPTSGQIVVTDGTTGGVKSSGYTIATSVPSGAKFTDTVYTHPTTEGNKHVPSGGSSGQFLGWDSAGTAKWVANPNTNTTYSAGAGMSLSGTTFICGTRWNAVTQGQKWSRIMYGKTGTGTVGCNGILTVRCTRGSVVVNTTLYITTSHSKYGQLVELSSNGYTPGRFRILVNSTGDFYIEIYDTAQSIASGTAQTWYCTFLPLSDVTVTAYTAFTDGTTVPDGFTAQNDFTTTTSDAACAIKNISRSGTTFTATRQNGSTFTFTQQDSNTTYSAGAGLSLSSTTFSLATSGATAGSYGDSAAQTPGYGSTFKVPYITVDTYGRVTAISEHTVKIPASDNTNTTYSAGKRLSLSGTTFSLAQNPDTRNDNQPPSWYFTNYPKMRAHEFKQCSKIGLSVSETYCTLTTDTPWTDSSGGYPTQYAEADGKFYMRVGTAASTWGSWIEVSANTVYTHPTTSGNKHIPSGGSSGQILRWSADGTATWGADNNTTYSAGAGLTLSGTTFSLTKGITWGTIANKS